jgi:hypothetical protein
VYLDQNSSIPLAFHNIFNKLRLKILNEHLELEVNTSTVKSDDIKSIKLPDDYSQEDMYGIDTFRIKDGYFVKKTIIEHKDMKSRKLIIANKSSFHGSMIDNGKLALIGNHKFYIMGDELEKIQKLLNSKLCDLISHFTKYGQDFLDKDAFTYIPDIRKIKTHNIINIESFYNYFGFTDDEINVINNIT